MTPHYGDPHEAAALRSLHRLTVVPGRPRRDQPPRQPTPPRTRIETPTDPDEQARLDAVRDEHDTHEENP